MFRVRRSSLVFVINHLEFDIDFTASCFSPPVSYLFTFKISYSRWCSRCPLGIAFLIECYDAVIDEFGLK